MVIDFLHGESKKDVSGISVWFSDSRCVYWGYLYNASGAIIGDFTAKDSVSIEKSFPGLVCWDL